MLVVLISIPVLKAVFITTLGYFQIVYLSVYLPFPGSFLFSLDL